MRVLSINDLIIWDWNIIFNTLLLTANELIPFEPIMISWVDRTRMKFSSSLFLFFSFFSFGPASNVPKLTHYGVV